MSNFEGFNNFSRFLKGYFHNRTGIPVEKLTVTPGTFIFTLKDTDGSIYELSVLADSLLEAMFTDPDVVDITNEYYADSLAFLHADDIQDYAGVSDEEFFTELEKILIETLNDTFASTDLLKKALREAQFLA